MSVDYNDFAKTFSNSRKKMKWEEIDYFLSFLEWKKDISILDIWCWNGRFLSHLKDKHIKYTNYLWIDLSDWLLKEASELHPEEWFLHLNMLNIDSVNEKFDYIFFIASFHHLDNINYRKNVLKKASKLLNKDWKIFMTNWSLNSELNKERYNNSIIKNSKNIFWSLDYNIKLWKFYRYYHCFDLTELDFLFKENWFNIIENRLYDTWKNFISIIQKKWDF